MTKRKMDFQKILHHIIVTRFFSQLFFLNNFEKKGDLHPSMKRQKVEGKTKDFDGFRALNVFFIDEKKVEKKIELLFRCRILSGIYFWHS